MYQKSDYVLYGNDGVCCIKDIVTRSIKDVDHKYYKLTPLNKKIDLFVPLDNEAMTSKIRSILSKPDMKKLIKTMPSNETIWIDDKNKRKQEYMDIIVKGDHQQLVTMIKTLYLKQQELEKDGKKFHIQDKTILETAQNIFHSEVSFVLDMDMDDVLPYINNLLDPVALN